MKKYYSLWEKVLIKSSDYSPPEIIAPVEAASFCETQ